MLRMCDIDCEYMVIGGMIFFFNDTATTEIYTLSLHDALPISAAMVWAAWRGGNGPSRTSAARLRPGTYFMQKNACPSCSPTWRSEEHTSELVTPISRMPSSA